VGIPSHLSRETFWKWKHHIIWDMDKPEEKQMKPTVCEVTQVASSIIERDAKSLKVPVTLL
jgi:hypothetical protein